MTRRVMSVAACLLAVLWTSSAGVAVVEADQSSINDAMDSTIWEGAGSQYPDDIPPDLGFTPTGISRQNFLDCETCPGDVDGSNLVDFDDVPLFADELVSPAPSPCADVNGDLKVDGSDIQPMVQLVLANGGEGTPCPVETGACCNHGGHGVCEYTTADECTGTEMIWLGPDSNCDDCPCAVPCEPNEGEPICEDDYEDHYNGGCGSVPVVFQSIECGQTICGTSGTFLYYGSSYRDTDWFEITTTESYDLYWTVEAEFAPSLTLIKTTTPANCNVMEFLNWATGGACEEVTAEALAAEPGTYWLWIGPDEFTGVPCGARYEATLTCVPVATGACCNHGGHGVCEYTTADECTGTEMIWLGPDSNCDDCPCAVPCEPNEGEPICEDGYIDNYNGGCGSVPVVFQPIECGQTICGTSGTFLFQGCSYRDDDWYEITTTESYDLYWTVEAEFAPLLTLIKTTTPADCNVVEFLDWATGGACEEVTAEALAAEPGTYWLWIGPDEFTGVPCGARYEATLTCVPVATGACCNHGGHGVCEYTTADECTGTEMIWLGPDSNCDDCPCAVPCEPNEGEPICEDGYIDNYNGGCGSEPVVFQLIECDQTICGTSGTFLVGSSEYRDTDWFEITTTEYSDLYWTVEAEFAPLLTLIKTTTPADCNVVEFLDWATGGACEEVTAEALAAEPGTYWLWIGPDEFTGVPCGARYEATLTCVPVDVLGACCDDESSTCVDDVRYEDCTGRFAMDTLCENLSPPCGGCPEDTFMLELFTDGYPGETTWDVKDMGGVVVCSGGPYEEEDTLYQAFCCLDAAGCYTFTIYDSYGDGICCNYGDGYYIAYFNDEVVAEGGTFGSEETSGPFGGGCEEGK